MSHIGIATACVHQCFTMLQAMSVGASAFEVHRPSHGRWIAAPGAGYPTRL